MNDTDMQLVVEPLSLSEMLNARIPKKRNKVEVKKTVEKTEGQKAVLQRHYAFDRCFDDHGNSCKYLIEIINKLHTYMMYTHFNKCLFCL